MQLLKLYLVSTMKQDETLTEREMRFGEQLGVSLYCVRKWVDGQRRINDDMKLKIEKETNGKISLEDMVRG